MTRSLAIRLLLAALLACGSLASPALAQTVALTGASLTKAREDCLSAAMVALPSQPSPKQAVQVLRDEAGEQGGKCAPLALPEPPPSLEAILVALEAGLAETRTAYGCAPQSDAPSCRGLQAADARYGELKLFKLGKTDAIRLIPGDHYSRVNAYWWKAENSSFGVKSGVGVSLMRLVLDASASDTALARRVEAETPYSDVQAEVLAANTPCAACEAEVARVISLWPLFDALERGFMAATSNNFDNAITRLEGLVGRWDAYHFGGGQGRAQLPWELALNSVVYARNRNDTEGWREPPSHALTLLHPSPALALKDVHGADTIVNVVEVFGFSWWDYDKKTYGRANELGVSAVAAYRERDDAKNWGYGALVRTPFDVSGVPLNLVWTRTKLNAGGHDDTIALSVDISRFVPKWNNAACLFKLPSCERTN